MADSDESWALISTGYAPSLVVPLSVLQTILKDFKVIEDKYEDGKTMLWIADKQEATIRIIPPDEMKAIQVRSKMAPE